MAVQATILNYQVKKIIGKGGMGTVYLATHAQIGRNVAIKELKAQFSKDRSIRERFKNEAALMANLSHPNIVALHDYIETPENVYLIMEYVDGITLDAYIQNISGPIPEAKAIEMFAKVLDAFAYAHQRNIVHRDIKPANIMLTKEGDIKILDFGIAKNIATENQQLTKTGIRLGTIYYMSPEQIRAQETDARSDIYSLGITLFEMITAHNPYPGDLSEFDISLKIVNEPLPKAKNFYPNVSEFIQKIIDKATTKNISQRFQSADEFKEALLGNISVELNKENTQVVEWTIQNNNKNETKNKEETNPQTEVFKEEERLLFENIFGLISNRKVVFYKGRDLFEKGEKSEIPLKKLIAAEYKIHREWFTGFLCLIISTYLLYTFLGLISILIASFLLPFSVLCFSRFPTIVLVRNDLKKIKMKAWPWHQKKARRFVTALKEELDDELA